MMPTCRWAPLRHVQVGTPRLYETASFTPKVRYNKEAAPWLPDHHSLGRWQAAASMPSNRALRAMQRAAQQPARRKKYIKPMFVSNKWKVLRGDEVMVMAGKDRGTTGTVLQVLRDKARPRVVVEGRNLVRPSQRWRLVPRCPAAHLPASARKRADIRQPARD
jgi:hypothetical protein